MASRLALALLCAAASLSATTGSEDLRAIERLELDPQRCYRVRDVYLEREDVKLYFTDGYVVFAKPVLGRVVAALFLGTEPTDIGEILLIPPDSAERQSAARFLGETILNEKFRNAMMFFTDDTADVLAGAMQDSPGTRLDVEAGARIAPRWSTVLRNLIESSASRALVDLRSGRSGSDGFFVAAIRGGTLGRFDVVVDPALAEQVVAGQLVRSGGRDYYEIWCRFQARSIREGRRSPLAALTLDEYRIDARLGSDLYLQVSAAARLAPAVSEATALSFDLSSRLTVTAVRIDGVEVEFLQRSQRGSQTGIPGGSSIVVAILPERLAPDGEHSIEFDYHGRVVSDAGAGVYFVGNRTNWYPRAGAGPATYDLRFRYPQDLDLVATGTRVEDRVDGGMRLSRFVSGKPIRLAGFNLGRYESAEREVGGFRVEVRATKGVERRLQPPRVPVVLPPSAAPPARRRDRRESPVLVIPTPPPASPAADIERIADDSADAFGYFLEKFGEPAMPVTVVSPVPGDFGQGFPGLVYASTLSYFDRGNRLLRPLSEHQRRFYSDLLRPHEISHQWWGNVAFAPLERDAWIMEALATYSSLLWLEESRGVAERDEALAEFRKNLLERSDGRTLESAGPIVLGRRLRTARLPAAYRVIVYEKGAWIAHMLRGILGDDSFFAMLRSLCERFASEPLTTERFREVAAGYVPDGHHDPDLRDFFDQWVHGTGIPRLEADWSQTEEGGRHRFELRLDLRDVPDYFPLRVPVEVHTLPGRSLVKTVAVEGGGESAGFSVVLRNPASRVVIDPDGWLLGHAQ